MNFEETFKQAKRSTESFPGTYAEARARHAALAPYGAPAAVLDALARSSALSPAARDAVVAALVAEQQTKVHPLWQAILLVAFEPMLRKLRGRLGKPQDNERDQRVIVAFLEAILRVRFATGRCYAPLALRWATQDVLFARVRAEGRAPTMVEYDDEVCPFGAFANGEPAAAEITAEEVLRLVGEDRSGIDVRGMLVATHSGSCTLKEYVACAYPDATDAERAAIGERFRRVRNRVLKRLRLRVSARA